MRLKVNITLLLAAFPAGLIRDSAAVIFIMLPSGRVSGRVVGVRLKRRVPCLR
jgi:hypothetical protein